MDKLILQPNELIILQPDEFIGAGEDSMYIRVGQSNVGTNPFETNERMLWKTLKQQTGNQTALYWRDDEIRMVRVVPESSSMH